MFIATANDLSAIPSPLRDRMEIIKISGYTEDEKLEIVKRYIVPKLLKTHGLKEKEFSITDDAIIQIIRRYTFEACVRNLERNIEKLLRKITKKLVEDKELKSVGITLDNLKEFLGIETYDYNHAGEEPKLGITNGLAYTEFGGDILYIEALKFDGTGKLLTTGKLGDVMKESAEAGFSYVRSKASDFGITSEQFNKFDFHLHVPEGATPKDGQSAGIAISGALMSVLTGMKVRSDIAMTGEITLSGRVLPIGGLKEKLLGALRGGIKKAIIPYDNIKDLEKIPEKVKNNMEIIPVKTIEEAFNILLVGYKRD
jgi:ATP-dependent Lon protease